MQVNDAQILKYGRHLRLPDGAKMIVGRNELENELLRNLKTSKYEVIELGNLIGAYSLVDEKISSKDLELALKIALTYTKHEVNKSYELKFKNQTHISTAFENKADINQFFIS